jgi:hypothetical protein
MNGELNLARLGKPYLFGQRELETAARVLCILFTLPASVVRNSPS